MTASVPTRLVIMDSIDLARKLRRNSTPEERLVWSLVRDRHLGCKFRRQVPFEGYVLDFVCFERRLVIEIDGSQHADNADDIRRDAFLDAHGYRVVRFWNPEVRHNLDGVRLVIEEALAGEPAPARCDRK